MARDVQPMAIILDLFLPDSRGLDLLKDLKADPLTETIPVMMLSVVDAHEEAMALGAADYLTKPVDPQVLLRKVQMLDREGARVLVVDDDSTSREILGKLLGQVGYQVQTARGGEEALASLKENPPQVMILDLMMLPVTGFDVLSRMQEHRLGTDVHVIVLTAKELSIAERQTLEVATAAILQKSTTSPDELIRVVRSCLTRFRPFDRWTLPPRPPLSALPSGEAAPMG